MGSSVRDLLASLRVDPVRMGRNLAASAGMVMAESVAGKLAPMLGRSQAHDVVAGCCRQAAERGEPLGEVLRADATVAAHLSDQELVAALDPAGYLGSNGELIDRALAAHIARAGGAP